MNIGLVLLFVHLLESPNDWLEGRFIFLPKFYGPSWCELEWGEREFLDHWFVIRLVTSSPEECIICLSNHIFSNQILTPTL